MFARTERLLLRPGFAEDAPTLAATVGEEAIARNLARLPWPYSLADATAFLAMEQRPGEHSLLIFMRTGEQPRLVGGIGLHPVDADPTTGMHDWGRGAARELGYWIARPFWGLGIATEAGRALLSAARALRSVPIVSAHFADNPASGRVLQKLGFRHTGRVVPRYSTGRRANVPCALFESADDGADGSGDGTDGPGMADLIYRDSPFADNGMDCLLAA